MKSIIEFRAILILIALLTSYGLSAQVFIQNSSDDTTMMVLDNGNVGIGITDPQQKLDVDGTIKATMFSGNGSGLTGTGDHLGNHVSTQNIRLNNHWLSGDGGNEGIYIDSDGNVGLGTNDPDNKVEAYKYFYIGGDLNVLSNETVGVLGWFNNDENSLNQLVGEIKVVNRNAWWDGNIDKLDAAITFSPMENSIVSEAMRIDYNGRVGIGSLSPGYDLEVNGTFQADNVRSGTFDLPVSDGSSGQFLSYDGSWASPAGATYTAGDDLDLSGSEFSLEDDINISHLRAASSTGLRLYDDGGNMAMMIEDGGSIGIGTTNPGFNLEVNGTFQADNVRSGSFNLPTANGSAGQFLRYDGTWGTPAATDGDWAVSGNDVYTGTGGIYPSGNVGIGTISPSGNARLEIANMAAGVSGVKINSPGQNGMWVETPTINGIYVNTPGYYGFAVDSPSLGGFYVNNSSSHGMVIHNSTENGIFIDNSTNNGLGIYNSGWWGINVDTAGWAGICVKNTGTHGVDIYTTGGHGVQITSAAFDGVHVASASNYGIYIDDVDYDGLHVVEADGDGVDVNTTDVYGEWGIYTPDKVYGSNVTTDNMSIYGYNAGRSTLEPGDVVSISRASSGYLQGANGKPVVKVTMADSRNSEAVIGVVEYKVKIGSQSDKRSDGSVITSERFAYDGEYASPGDFISIIVFGIADVKVQSSGTVKAGQKLTVSEHGGEARTLTETDSWLSGVLGRALESSDGRSTIKAFINCK